MKSDDRGSDPLKLLAERASAFKVPAPTFAASNPTRTRAITCSDCGSGPHDNWLNCFALPGEDCPGMRIVVIDRRVPWSWNFRKSVRALIHWLKPKLGRRPVAFRVKTRGGWMYFDDEETARTIAGDGDYQGLYVRDGGR